MEKTPEEMELEIYKLRQLTQVMLMRLMLVTGAIKSEIEYGEEIAEVFDMVARGLLRIPKEIDYVKIRSEVRKLTRQDE